MQEYTVQLGYSSTNPGLALLFNAQVVRTLLGGLTSCLEHDWGRWYCSDPRALHRLPLCMGCSVSGLCVAPLTSFRGHPLRAALPAYPG